MRRVVVAVAAVAVALLAHPGCQRAPSRGRVLALSLALFSKDAAGRQVPGQATAGFLAPDREAWRRGTLSDPQSNVFHKLLEYCPAAGECGLLTVAGTEAALKLWRHGEEPQTLWKADFGGRFSRLRDAEVADVLGDGVPTVVVGTHDQGVVALVRPDGRGGFAVREIDRQADTFVHEVEVGDLDGDGVVEVYATPSRPNVLDGTPQPGTVVRYVPARGEGRTVVADLGDRHAKEILVADLDADGRDELYASVEAVSGGSVEIRRYRAGTPPDGGRDGRRASRPAVPLPDRRRRGRRRPPRARRRGGEGGPLAPAPGRAGSALVEGEDRLRLVRVRARRPPRRPRRRPPRRALRGERRAARGAALPVAGRGLDEGGAPPVRGRHVGLHLEPDDRARGARPPPGLVAPMRVNRPHGRLRLEDVLRGGLRFARRFRGTLATETMLVSGANDSEADVEAAERTGP
jgi:hypothetical protein